MKKINLLFTCFLLLSAQSVLAQSVSKNDFITCPKYKNIKKEGLTYTAEIDNKFQWLGTLSSQVTFNTMKLKEVSYSDKGKGIPACRYTLENTRNNKKNKEMFLFLVSNKSNIDPYVSLTRQKDWETIDKNEYKCNKEKLEDCSFTLLTTDEIK
ncbi:DUF3757 domain-containing protein [Candidatus Fukatsuia symbiotica]|uniref:DUF3757 domain-containing protein n=1 Tax=Candidatus Fukatsuia symbiotica TaxID=1878942 RepID=A0A2U8I7P0_9GAMM|nr:DUF3757 domain-containing protein [Candidatus Fukatsuia symbiotica]AWK14205.1 hypothetical protein CCS41_06500 [Candidatus Fukatsuia symbiotica]MEA9444447.1 DUF3757 domain-containing protein [Candidatus Fukatsuia symbiotica]